MTRGEICPSSDTLAQNPTLLPSRIRHDVVGGVVRTSNIDDRTPIVSGGSEEVEEVVGHI